MRKLAICLMLILPVVVGITIYASIRIAGEYFANNEADVYTVTYYNWNGTVYASYTLKLGEQIPEVEPPQRDGYEFLGWRESEDDDNILKHAVFKAIASPQTEGG